MISRSAQIGYVRRYRSIARCRAVIALIVFWSVGGCSLANFDYLTEGDSGGDSSTGGQSNSAGGNTGGSNARGTGGNVSTATPQGGAKATSVATGGSGGVSQGGTKATSVATGGSTPTNCAFVGTGGQLLTPPSQGFESDMAGWTTVASGTGPLSRVSGGTDSCEGTWYLHLTGTQRAANWDGPSFNVLPYVVLGNTYEVSLAVRLSPSSAPKSAANIALVVAKVCADTGIAANYEQSGSQAVGTSWVRLTYTFTATMAGCSLLSSILTYLDTGNGTAPFASVDLDDYKFLDVTVASSGTGGTSAMGGTSGTVATGTGSASAMGGTSG